MILDNKKDYIKELVVFTSYLLNERKAYGLLPEGMTT